MKIMVKVHALLEIDTEDSHMLSPVPDTEELEDFVTYLLRASDDVQIRKIILDEQ